MFLLAIVKFKVKNFLHGNTNSIHFLRASDDPNGFYIQESAPSSIDLFIDKIRKMYLALSLVVLCMFDFVHGVLDVYS